MLTALLALLMLLCDHAWGAEYQLTSGTSVVRETDGVIIPDDPGNQDWWAYQAWLAAGNTPDPGAIVSLPASVSPSAVIGACSAQNVGAKAHVSQTLGGQLTITTVICNGTQWIR